MPHIKSNRRKLARALIAGLALLVACLGLAACGSSGSSSTSTSANAAATSTTGGGTGGGGTGGGPTGGPGAGRFSALRECLAKNGITLPKRTPGQRPPGGAGGFFGGRAGLRLPKGVSRAQMQAALEKCRGVLGNGFRAGLRRLNTPTFTAAVAKFAVCMRQHGINVPAPNTSGNGPIFDTKGINTTSPQFTAAETQCRRLLQGAFGAPGAR